MAFVFQQTAAAAIVFCFTSDDVWEAYRYSIATAVLLIFPSGAAIPCRIST